MSNFNIETNQVAPVYAKEDILTNSQPEHIWEILTE